MKRPRKLHRYCVNHRLETHELGEDCCPQFVETNQHGTLFRCRHGYDERNTHDFYGYDQKKKARSEEIESLKLEIIRLKVLLD